MAKLSADVYDDTEYRLSATAPHLAERPSPWRGVAEYADAASDASDDWLCSRRRLDERLL